MNDYGEDRLKIWEAYKGYPHKIVRRMFVDYSRYFEAKLINESLEGLNVDVSSLIILDFGCGAGDYGMFFARKGVAHVDCWDFPRSSDFVDYRIKREKLKNIEAINADENELSYGFYDLIIYGEVLEHLSNPIAELANGIDAGASFIYTSSYPYRSDDKDDPYWSNDDHHEEARVMQAPCRELLESNYNDFRLDGEARLWVRK